MVLPNDFSKVLYLVCVVGDGVTWAGNPEFVAMRGEHLQWGEIEAGVLWQLLDWSCFQLRLGRREHTDVPIIFAMRFFVVEWMVHGYLDPTLCKCHFLLWWYTCCVPHKRLRCFNWKFDFSTHALRKSFRVCVDVQSVHPYFKALHTVHTNTVCLKLVKVLQHISPSSWIDPFQVCYLRLISGCSLDCWLCCTSIGLASCPLHVFKPMCNNVHVLVG